MRERQLEGTPVPSRSFSSIAIGKAPFFAKSLVVPKDGKPVTSWANEPGAWSDVTRLRSANGTHRYRGSPSSKARAEDSFRGKRAV